MKFLKSLAVAFLVLVATAALAQTTINLPTPQISEYTPPNVNCPDLTGTRGDAWTYATGFSADGNYVTGASEGWIACGHSGRGSNLIYTRYCFADTWDLSGNLVSVTVLWAVAGKTVAGDSTTCPPPYQGEGYTNSGGYEAYTVTDSYYGYIQDRYAVLVTP